MNALDEAIDIIKRFEGCRLKSYQDVVGVWTIGYGETIGVTEGMEWTQEYADSMLAKRVAYFINKVLEYCPQLHLESDKKVAACTSLAYNIGIGAFSVSSVCRNTTRRNYKLAAKSFLLWNKAGGREIKGLTIRRQLESKIYLS